jgi:RimJ/RimL family protein N-acetyltransferase
VHRRSASRRLLPGTWDVVGGHVEPGETPRQAVAREIEEETGWRLRRIEPQIADWEWTHDGVTRRELDYLVAVDGDLSAPRLEGGKHDAYAWVGRDNLDLMVQGWRDGERRLRDIVARTAGSRLTDRLRLEPAGRWHAGDLWRLHQDLAVAPWYDGRWTALTAQHRAAELGDAWERQGVGKWMAYRRADGVLVGRGGLSRAPVDGQERLEVGWVVRSSLWRHGYATEIGRAGLAFAFGDLMAGQVVAFTEPHNRRSRAVMDRIGMTCAREIVHRGEPFVLYELDRDNAPSLTPPSGEPGVPDSYCVSGTRTCTRGAPPP